MVFQLREGDVATKRMGNKLSKMVVVLLLICLVLLLLRWAAIAFG